MDDARPERWRTVVRSAGEVLVTGGLVLLLFVVYELYVTDLLAGQRQEELSEQLYAEWDEAEGAPPDSAVSADVDFGRALAVLRIPRLGLDYRRVVLEGTTDEQLRAGPGHYEDTALPGEQGNFAVAGHRVGKGSPFLELDTLRPGDPIVVETATSWLVYRVLGNAETGNFAADPSGIPGQQIVTPFDIDVISPTPNASEGAPASGAYLTLTTCHPRFSARERLIVHAALDGPVLAKADLPGGPPALLER